MTVKTSLLVLFLTCLGLGAQTPPAPADPSTSAPPPNPARDAAPTPNWNNLPQGAPTNQVSALPTNGISISNLNALLHRPMRRLPPGNTNAAAGAPVSAAAPPPFPQPSVPPAGLTNLPAAPAAAPGPRNIVPGVTPPGFPTPSNAPTGPAPEAALPPGAVAPGEQVTQIKPPPRAANEPPEKMLGAGEIRFPATDLNQVLQVYAELVNRTILRPTILPAPTITLITQTPLTRKEAIQAFDAVLYMNGIAMVNIGDKFVKALPLAQAGASGAELSRLDPTNFPSLPNLGAYATHVVQLKYTKPTEIVQALVPFASVPTAILAIDTSAILVLRDATENVKRMLEMIAQIDVAVPAEYISEVIPIKYALASDIASALNSLSSGGSTTPVGSSGAGAGGHGVAGGFGRAGSTMGGMSGGMGSSPYGTSPYGTPGTPGATGYGSSATTRPGTTPGTGSSFTQRLQSIISKAATSGEIQVLGQTKIIADERTNSLLIFASREDMKMIKDIVNKLDIVLAQVLIEAVVIQVSLDTERDLGVSYVQNPSTPTTIGNSYRGLSALNNKNIFDTSNTGSGTNIFANLPGGFSYLAQLGHNQDLNVFITALASDTKAKILQRPRIQTSNAKQASLFVGQSRPYPTGSYYGGAGYGGYSSIQQLQIGVSLEVTPLINPDGLVVMDIHQKIDSFQGNVTIANVGDVPITSSKEAMASVAVRDHDTIMLGGLIETDKTENNSGIPVLKDIPLLGYLFRSSTKSESRNELIVLIRPTVLPTPEVAALTAKAEKDRMPGVRATEQEIQFEEAKRAREADKEYQKLEQSRSARPY